MAIRIPKPPLPVEVAPPPPAPPPLTREDVQAMLDANNAMWAAQVADLAKSLSAAIAAIPKPQPAPKRSGARISFKYDERGLIVGADLTPKE